MSEATQDPQAPTEGEDLTFGDIVWVQFKKNKIAVVSLIALAALFGLAIGAPLLASARPFIYTTAEGTTYPWFTSLFDRNYFENPVDIFFNLILCIGWVLFGVWWIRVKQIQAQGLPKRPRRKRMRQEAMALLALFFGMYGWMLANPHSAPYVQHSSMIEQAELKGETVEATFPPIAYSFRQTGFKPLAKPSAKHLLGVDQSTRDVAVRILYGTRISLTIGVIAVSIYVTIGIILGALAGFFGGRTDMAIQRMIEIMMSLPTLIVILVLVAFLERPSIFHIMLVIGLVRWTGVARLVRGEFYRLRKQDFVASAVALGFPTWRVIFQHVLPNALGPVLVAATFGVASAILLESTLSFLGLGDLSAPSWGQTLSEGYASGAWHLILAPGFAIFITVSLLNLVGEGLRDALDPKMRR